MTRKVVVAALNVVLLIGLGGRTSGAATRQEIDAGATAAIEQFRTMSGAHRDLLGAAAAMLVFPRITKGGVGIAGEYGEGVLLMDGKAIGYYNISSASVGLTVGVETYRELVVFMTTQALNRFTSTRGWSVGAGAGAALISRGKVTEVDTKTSREPVLGFVFAERGLIGDLSLEGSKFSKIDR